METLSFCVATNRLFNGNGVDVSVAQFARELARRHNVKLAAVASDMTVPGVDIQHYPAKDPTKIRMVAKELDKQKFDFISTHITPFDLVATFTKARHILHDPGVPPGRLIKNFPDFYLWSAVNLSRFIAARKASIVMPISRFLGDQFRWKYLYRGSMKVIPYGIKFPELEPEPIDKYGKFILFVGKHRQYKGVHRLIEIYAELKKELHEPIKLVTIGGTEEPWYERQLRSMAETVGDVHMLGYVPDVWPYYAGCSAFATCSSWEGQDRPVIEAQYMGKPVVAFNNCSHPEVILHGALANDRLEFKAALKQYLLDDGTDLSVRSKVVEQYSIKSMVRHFIDAIGSVG